MLLRSCVSLVFVAFSLTVVFQVSLAAPAARLLDFSLSAEVAIFVLSEDGEPVVFTPGDLIDDTGWRLESIASDYVLLRVASSKKSHAYGLFLKVNDRLPPPTDSPVKETYRAVIVD